MTKPSDWPALGRNSFPADGVLEYERGIWGKVHGQASDFRWIARSDGFAREQPDLGKLLNFGGEEVPTVFQAWLNLGDRCYAVTCYPSRAIDASGRRDFLEKQVLEWHRPKGVPAALGALLLLPQVAGLDDETWWDRYSGEPWTQPDFSLPLSATDHKGLPASDQVLAHAIERGRQDLRSVIDPKALQQLYDQLLERPRPAFLLGLDRPLSAEALAVLFLPLSQERADRISLAGWIPTSRPAYDVLASRWDVLVTGPDLAVPALPSPSQKARHMAKQLLATEEGQPDHLKEEEVAPQEPIPTLVAVDDHTSRAPLPSAPSLHGEPRPGLELDLARPDPGPPSILYELYKFARSADRRWLSPDTLKKAGSVPRFGSQDAAARLILSWVQQVRDRRPAHADRDQWEVKVDLLRSAALILIPAPETWAEVGPFRSEGRLPALFFGLLLDNRGQRDALLGLGRAALSEMLNQSLSCGTKRWSSKVRHFIMGWQGDPRRGEINIQVLIGEALKAHPK